MKKILKITAGLITGAVLFFTATVGYLTLREYRPADIETLSVSSGHNMVELEQEIQILSYNIGYGGLNKDADFFMDGGTQVNPDSKKTVEANINGISKIIRDQNADILLLQEVDEHSNRSFYLNEKEILEEQLEMPGILAYNFKCDFVPFPFPFIGQVQSGVLTMSDYSIEKASRISLPESFTWPMKICNLKRCMLETRMPIKGSDKELVVINFHLEAYDSGEGKIAQSKALAKKLQEEYEKGNYVIAGGDFNQTFEGMDKYPIINTDSWVPGTVSQSDLPTGFHFAVSDNVPTCRLLNKPYTADSQVYVIDGFIVSDNVEINTITNIDTQFEYTDHQPVSMKFILK